jgi:hypothetical protein
MAPGDQGPRLTGAQILFLALLAPALAAADPAAGVRQPAYDEWFTAEALRVELVHAGTRGREVFAVENLAAEPLWPGTRRHLVDPTGYGQYRFRVLDRATGTEIFSQGYCSLFGEWLATAEAASGSWRSMPEPVRLPMPRAPVILVLETRGDDGDFSEIQRLEIDGAAYDVRRDRTCDFGVTVLHDCGRAPDRAVDVVIVPDGYTEAQAAKLDADARRFTDVLLSEPPFDRHRDGICVRLVRAWSREAGTDEPRKGIFRDTAVDTTFDTFRSPRYLTTQNLLALRRVAALAPYDAIFVMVNTSRYGGGGIFGTYAVFTSDSEYSEYVMIHEFGHSFGGLGDEYYTSSTGYDDDQFYRQGVEPWEPNLTIRTARDEIKWGALIPPEVPVPTPDEPRFDGTVGLFEGGGYKARGIFRPTRDSKMFHKGLLPYGPVSEAAIERMIAYFTGDEL